VALKARRQAAILGAIGREPVRSQEQLRRVLQATGHDVTQATLSRDIREMGLVKGGPGGRYHAPGAAGAAAPSPDLGRAVAAFLVRADRAQHTVVLRTGPGQAPPLAEALDRSGLAEIVGTLAGENTIFVMTPDARRARALVRRLEALAGEGRD
jgi:transcriptional regulator of arginine metabolism